MMSLKKLCSTFILTLVLATSMLAGGMEGGEIAPPTPPASMEVASTSVRMNVEQSFFRLIMVSPVVKSQVS